MAVSSLQRVVPMVMRIACWLRCVCLFRPVARPYAATIAASVRRMDDLIRGVV
jgi:hypothetical protein